MIPQHHGYVLLVMPDTTASPSDPEPAEVVAQAELVGRYGGTTLGVFGDFIVFGFDSAGDRADASCYLAGATSPWDVSMIAFGARDN